MISAAKLQARIAELLEEFYKRRQAKLSELKLLEILRRKNPYLYRARGVKSAAEIVQEMLEAFVTSSDEGIFGDCFFEPLAKWAAMESNNDGTGRVIVTTAEAPSVDVIIQDAVSYIAVAVKSGTSVFTHMSRQKQEEDFASLRARVAKLKKHYEPVVAYCYGRKAQRENTAAPFTEVAGQACWERLTGEPDFYIRIVEVMKDIPERYVPTFRQELVKAENRLVKEFSIHFVDVDGGIDWKKLVQFNSGKERPKLPKTK